MVLYAVKVDQLGNGIDIPSGDVTCEFKRVGGASEEKWNNNRRETKCAEIGDPT